MSERLSYEEQMKLQLQDIPLPDEDRAWDDMQKRLDDDDDNGGIVWWRTGCAMWGMILLLVVAAGWWIFRPEKWFVDKTSAKNNTTISPTTNPSTEPGVNKPADTAGNNDNPNSTGSKSINGNDSSTTTTIIDDKPVNSGTTQDNSSNPISKTLIQRDRTLPVKSNNSDGTIRTKNATVGSKKKKPPVTTQVDPGKKLSEDNKAKPPTSDPVDIIPDNPDDHKLPANPAQLDSSGITDVKKERKKDSINKITKSEEATTKEKKKNKTFYTAGLSIHQQLPIAGQKLSPYNSLGRKGTLMDYIPSLYFRMIRENKWFLQAELRYGAPQYTKELDYQQEIVPDPGVNPPFTTTTTSKLQKTYYHQLPVSFHYYVAKDWSVGGGVIWNRFSSAISDREVNRRDNQSQLDTVISKVVIKDKNDSLFTKNYFQAFIESQYQLNRFSIGARYAFGLQPFIKFNLPGGVTGKESSTSVQVFLRYQLWRSKEK